MAEKRIAATVVLCSLSLLVAARVFVSSNGKTFLVPPQSGPSVAGLRAATISDADLRSNVAGNLSVEKSFVWAGSIIAAAGMALSAAAAVGFIRHGGSRRTAQVRRQAAALFPNQYPLPKNFWPGERGYSMNTPAAKPLPPPARQSLSRVEDAIATFAPSDFYTAPFVSLSKAGVNKVGTCTWEPDSIVAPAENVPAYVKPKVGQRMEKERGAKRPPKEDEAYEQYVGKRCTLSAMAGKAASSSLSKDLIVDRSALTLLLDYVGESLANTVKMKSSPVDLVKITQEPGKGLIVERLFEKKNLWAERRGYRGAWKRSEASNNGTYTPAWQRLATGDTSHKVMMVTGLQQIAGTSAGIPPAHYQFVEYNLGGLSMLTRARTDASIDDKVVELNHKNWFYRQDLTMLSAYATMLLGGIDLMSIGIHRSGKLIKVLELTLEDLVAKEPKIVEAAERRFGRLASLLEKMKAAVSTRGEGPWVLQWQDGDLVLGDYAKKEVEEQEEEDEIVEESVSVEA